MQANVILAKLMRAKPRPFAVSDLFFTMDMPAVIIEPRRRLRITLEGTLLALIAMNTLLRASIEISA